MNQASSHPLRWLLFAQLGVVVGVTVAAYLGALPPLPPLPYLDKLMHALLFGALALWLDLWFDPATRWLGVPPALLLPFAGAAVEETAQLLSQRRSFDLLDLAADAVGLLLFFAMGRWLRARRSERAGKAKA